MKMNLLLIAGVLLVGKITDCIGQTPKDTVCVYFDAESYQICKKKP